MYNMHNIFNTYKVQLFMACETSNTWERILFLIPMLTNKHQLYCAKVKIENKKFVNSKMKVHSDQDIRELLF